MLALDGLRAIAILLVMWHHMSPDHDSNRGLISIPFKIADIGWSGVDLFFVLSGFLITGILLRVRDGQVTLCTFFARRLLRIVPAYFVALTLVLLVVPAITQWYPVPEFERQWPYWTYLSNYVRESYEPIGGLFRMSHFWSLAVEMQFYLLWPFVVLTVPARRVLIVATLGLCVALILRYVSTVQSAHWTVTFGYLYTRMDALLTGGMLAIVVREDLLQASTRKWLVAAIVISGGILSYCAWRDLGASIFRDGVYLVDIVLRTSYPTILAAFYGSLTALAISNRLVAKPLSWRGFGPIAKYSYGAYIIHFLLLETFLRHFGPTQLRAYSALQGDLAIYAFFAIASVVTFALAFVSFHAFEKRFIAMGH